MNILVTGGAGYIGSTLVPLLLHRGHRVRVVDSLQYGGESLLHVWSHPAFEFRHADIRDRAAIRDALHTMHAVVHLAAVVGDPACAREPDLAHAVNLEASLELLEAAQKTGVGRFVFASTCSNYGKMADPDGYVDEDSELRPVSLYAETKVAVEHALLQAAHTTELCATPLRFATVFGVSPRMRFDLTVNEFAMELVTKHTLNVFGEQFWRPYVHVRDIARAVDMVLSAPETTVRGQVFNVGATDQNYQKQQLVELIMPYVPQATVEYVRRDEDPRDYRVSFARIKQQLDFTISRTVPEGISEIVQLLRDSMLMDIENVRYRN